jgi:hypothetical protein
MVTCQIDPALERKTLGDFRFPLGVYPVEEMKPKAGYTLHFEPADGGEEEDWEEWPDRYIFDIVASAERVPSLVTVLVSMLPGRIFPILDVMGHDAYREIDPFVAYEPVGIEHFMEELHRFKDFLFEDGMCGFGAMAEEPFFYLFVDEHKIVTVRAEPEMKERIERILAAFGLEAMEEPAGADASAHEHRGVLRITDDAPNLLSMEEIIERLRDRWGLSLNVDPESNTDDDGRELGTTLWRCVLRRVTDDGPARYAEVVLYADCLRQAEDIALDAVDELDEQPELTDTTVIEADRLDDEQLKAYPGKLRRPKGTTPEAGFVLAKRWIP